MAQPQWVTPAGSLGTIPEGVFFSTPLQAIEPVITLPVIDSVADDLQTITLVFNEQPSNPFETGTNVILSGFVPSSYNGTYVVLNSTKTSISIHTSLNEPITTLGSVSNTQDTVYYSLLSGRLPDGMQIQQSGLLTGVPTAALTTVQGVPSEVGRDVTSRFAVRAFTRKQVSGQMVINRLADRTFELTVTGQDAPEFITPPGQIAQYFDGSVVTGLQVEYTDTDPDQIVTVRLVSGQLPPGLTISAQGVISGFIPVQVTPEGTGYYDADGEAWDEYPYNFSTISESVNYEFTLEVSDGTASNLRTFSIFVWSRASMTADNTQVTADNTFITADVSPIRPPILLNPPGNIGSVRNDNFYAYQFNGVDLDGEAFVIFPIITIGQIPNVNVIPPGNPQVVLNTAFPGAAPGNAVLDETLDDTWVYDGTVWQNFGFLGTGYSSELPPGLSVDPVSGWLYGYIPNTGISSNTYNFSLLIKKANDPTIFSGPYNYNLTVIGPIDSEVIWLTPADPIELARVPSSLGSIVNGSTSTLYVKAVNVSGLELQYELDLGTQADPVYNLLPQGLQLLPSGDIAGRCSFNTFALDGGLTTFDVTKQNGEDPTTFDMVHVFTVRATSVDGVVNVTKTFSITVVREYNDPYENLYIQCMPPESDRDLINDLLLNSDIFPLDLIYRPTDPNFGVARNVIYNHAYGLAADTISRYYQSLVENHYWKDLVLGEIKTAQATDEFGNVIYEVVYSQVVDNLVNNQGQSVSKVVELPYPIDYGDNLVNVESVTPNSLINMRDQVIDVVGQISNILPNWMISKQQDGRVLGFTPAWVIAYTKPGQAKRIAYYIQQYFNRPLNLVDFEVDRYELDRLLTKNWDPELTDQYHPNGMWVPTPPELTTFDVTRDVVTWLNDSDEPVLWVNDDLDVVTWISGAAIGSPTTFDQNSMQFTAPVDMYSTTQAYDKYLVFPKRNILE